MENAYHKSNAIHEIENFLEEHKKIGIEERTAERTRESNRLLEQLVELTTPSQIARSPHKVDGDPNTIGFVFSHDCLTSTGVRRTGTAVVTIDKGGHLQVNGLDTDDAFQNRQSVKLSLVKDAGGSWRLEEVGGGDPLKALTAQVLLQIKKTAEEAVYPKAE